MRDQQHRAGELEQVVFQPLDAGDVEVVRRLVEQQQVGRVDEQLGERDPRPLAAAKAVDRLLEILVVEADAVQRGLQLVPPRVAAELVEA